MEYDTRRSTPSLMGTTRAVAAGFVPQRALASEPLLLLLLLLRDDDLERFFFPFLCCKWSAVAA